VKDGVERLSGILAGRSQRFRMVSQIGLRSLLTGTDGHSIEVGLTDYEIRDLNDEINKLMREKGHWERQIVTLGGANYRRARTAMLDDEGREVPGTRGYK
jgi:hypothetical protein